MSFMSGHHCHYSVQRTYFHIIKPVGETGSPQIIADIDSGSVSREFCNIHHSDHKYQKISVQTYEILTEITKALYVRTLISGNLCISIQRARF
jgi:hypothetical protein